MNRDQYSERMKDMGSNIPKLTAEEVADKILDTPNSEHDIFSWQTWDSFYSDELLAEIICAIASFKYNKDISMIENRSERLTLIEDCIKAHLYEGAKREGYPA